MNVIILAGGYAERLWPLTENYPKTLLSLAGKPVLYHLLENVSRVRGIRSITIAIDENKKDYFLNRIEDINVISTVRPKFSIHGLDETGSVKGPLTKMYEIFQEADKYQLTGNDFLVLGADNVFGFDLENICAFYRSRDVNCIAIQQRLEPIEATQVGVPAVDASGQVRSIEEKPRSRRVHLVSTACYCLEAKALRTVADYLKLGEQEALGSFIGWLAACTRIISYQFDEEWYDIGTRQGLLNANSMLLKRGTEAQKSPDIIDGRTYIEEPVYLEKLITLRNSSIGPNVYIERDCTIVKSRVENSVIYAGSSLLHCNLKNSVVGPGSIIEGNISEAVFGPKTRLVEERG